MKSSFRKQRRLTATLIASLTLTLGAVDILSSSTAVAQSQDEGSRQIVLDEFTKARPAKQSVAASDPSNKTTGTRTRPPTPTNRLAKRPTYRRAGTTITASVSAKQNASTEELGITVWRLRQSKANDGAARLLVMENTQSSNWTPERIEADTPLAVGERVRISVESPRVGYLYVIDREQFSDGSLGDAYLIFPTLRTSGGNNEVRPGKLIDIPAQEDNPSYFTLVPGPSRSDQVAELLSIMITSQPLDDLRITDKPLKLSRSDVAKLEGSSSNEVERFEMVGGAGTPWSKEEMEASARVSARLLTQEEPAPQTIYRVSGKGKNTLMVRVPLRYGR